MSRNTTKVAVLTTSIGSAAAITSKTLYSMDISNYKSYRLTIRCSSSTGFNYDIKTAPINRAEMFSSQTGGHFAEGVCSTIMHDNVINNNMSFLIITGSATGTVSGSNVNVILSCIERE